MFSSDSYQPSCLGFLSDRSTEIYHSVQFDFFFKNPIHCSAQENTVILMIIDEKSPEGYFLFIHPFFRQLQYTLVWGWGC